MSSGQFLADTNELIAFTTHAWLSRFYFYSFLPDIESNNSTVTLWKTKVK